MDAKDFYSKKINDTVSNLNKTKKSLSINAWVRGLTFVFGIIISFLFFKYTSNLLGFSSIVIFLFLLIFFVKKSTLLNQKINYLNILLKLNQDEQKALENDFSNFYDGNEFINTRHDFSFDLDIFGKNSIYQMLNRAFTKRGKTLMAKKLENPLIEANQIIEKQNTVEELSKDMNLIQDFLTNASISAQEEKNTHSDNSNSSDIFQNKFSNTFWKIALIIFPIISISVILLVSFSIFSEKILYLYTIIALSIIGIFIKYINKIHATLTKQAKIHRRYSDLLLIIEKSVFQSSELKNLQSKITTEDKSASEILKKYSQLLTALDNRLNFIFALILNTLVLWDIQFVRKIEIYIKKYMGNFDMWLDLIAEFETYCSLAVFKFNNPQYCFPTFNSNFEFHSIQLGHPIIPANKLIANDFSFSDQTRTFIITGANMAGKSTFLRTIGVNFILAQIGSVVCAGQMNIHPMNIITSIRITDSLASDESYFYAELKRLHYIIKKIDENPNTLIIIDEMLRGTNSDDKHKGSEGLLKKLTQRDVISFLATHDVALGDLENKFPGKIKNFCFEAEIKNNELFFDYKIQEGISKNLNASFLMKKMGIIE